MLTTAPTYLRETLADLGLTIAAYSATRGDYVRSGQGTHGRLVGISPAGCVVVVWDSADVKDNADRFAAAVVTFDEQRRRRGERIDAKAAAARRNLFTAHTAPREVKALCDDDDCDDEGHEWEIVAGQWCYDHAPRLDNVPQEWVI